jgi:hypothetical protein
MTRVLPQDPVKRLSALATYAYMYGLEQGGSSLRTALLVEVLVQSHELSVFEAIDLARNDSFDPRVREAGDERDRLLDAARRAVLAAEQDGGAA